MSDDMTHSITPTGPALDQNVVATHDLFLRALAVPVEKQKKRKKADSLRADEDERVAREPKWPEHILAFDTESRLTVEQSLMFGVWQRCKLVDQKYEVIEEGVFYDDDL